MKLLKKNIMGMISRLAGSAVLIVLLTTLLAIEGCDDSNENPPLAYVDISINPNSTMYNEINAVGGWMYLDESDGVPAPSRGLIVYRSSTDQFMAYDRTPPYKADSCCNAGKTYCTKLLVGDEYPFVVDTCTNSRYLIIDGSPVSGPSNKYLYVYYTEYDGYTLYIHN
jgi:hypothetical protein